MFSLLIDEYCIHVTNVLYLKFKKENHIQMYKPYSINSMCI